MTHYHSAWVTITGKVFVPRDELNTRLQVKFDDLSEVSNAVEVATVEQEQEAFEELAREKISDLFPTDDPLKFNEAEVDLKSYKS